MVRQATDVGSEEQLWEPPGIPGVGGSLSIRLIVEHDQKPRLTHLSDHEGDVN